MANRARRGDGLTAALFLTPAFLIVGVFGLLPIVDAVALSLFQWKLKPGPFVGLGNYLELFGGWENLVLVVALTAALAVAAALARSTRRALRWWARTSAAVVAAALFWAAGRVWADGDADFMRSLQVTVWFAFGTVPVQMLFGLLLALGLEGRFTGKSAFRVTTLIPYVVPVLASAGVFAALFSLRSDSVANQVLSLFGQPPAQWLKEARGVFAGVSPAFTGLGDFGDWLAAWTAGPSLALVCVLFFNDWLYSGYYALIFSNGLAAIPREVYEAARLDGARGPTLLFRVVLPLLSPTSYFLILLGVIGTFKAFTTVYALRDPAAGGATDPASVFIFFQFFRQLRYGYAAALSLVLFALVLALTLLQRRLLERRVFYG
jgi:multiple sugar transport system permease protein